MTFQPLTKEQYQKAINAGFKPDEIIANEQKRKLSESSTPTTTDSRGIVSSAVNTLLVKPAARATEAIGRTGILGSTIKKGYEEMSGQPQNFLPYAGNAGVVEPQKALGQGGGTQLFSDALKSATYLAPYGEIAGAGSSVAGKVLSEGASRVVGGALAGVTGGYTADVAQKLDQNRKITAASFIPGFATLLGGLTGGVLEAGGVGIEKLTAGSKAYGHELEQQSFKLTPAQKTNLGSRLDELTKLSLDNIPAGSPTDRLAYAQDLKDHYESNLQFFLDSVAKENRNSTSISKDTFVRQLNAIKGAYKYDRDAEAAYKQIDSAIQTIRNQYPGEAIPVNKLNVFKRTTYQNAYNQAGNKVLDTIEHDIGDAARVAIERATKGGMIGDKTVGEFNHEYGNLIQLTKLLKLASGRPELGFTKRITARIIGGLVGSAVGGGIPGVVGGELVAEPIANAVAGTAPKTTMARKLSSVEPKKIGSIIQRIPSAFSGRNK